MCLACAEYLKGKLRDSEFKKNLREYVDEEHEQKALEQAGIQEKDLKSPPPKKK